MRNNISRIAAVFLVFFVSLTGTAAWAAAGSPVVEAGKSADDGKEKLVMEQSDAKEITQSGICVERLEAAQGAEQVIVAVGSGIDSSTIHVAYFKKGDDGRWSEQFYVPGYCGYNGMSEEKREGDRRTPVGTFHFTNAFGIRENPGSVLPYKVLDQYDYWVDDSSSSYYNQMVSTRTTPVAWKSAEHLIAVNPCYNYSIALDYNTAERVPGRGSAIFLHGLHPVKTWTEGCIAIPEEQMKLLVQQIDENTRIVIVPDAGHFVYVD